MNEVSRGISGFGAVNSAAVGHSVRNFLREIPLPIAQLKAEYFILRAASLINNELGFKLGSLPKPVILSESASTLAQCYKENLIVYGHRGLNYETINHELFHYAQEKSRALALNQDPEVDFLRAFGLGNEVIVGEKGNPTQQSLSRASMLWNGANEAGAYLFGFFATHTSTEDGMQLAREILIDFERHTGINLKRVSDSVLNFIFTPGSNLEEYTQLGEGKYYVTKVIVAMVISGMILEQNNLNARKSLRDLLDLPEKTLSRIKALGIDGAKASLERITSLLNED